MLRITVIIVMTSLCLAQSKLNGGGGHLYISNGSHILRMFYQGTSYEPVLQQPRGKIVGLAVATNDDLLFWSDTDPSHQAIYRSDLNGNDVTEIVTGVVECNGLSVDWVSRHIYWTDAGKKTLEIANYDGSGRRILVSYGLVNPRGIVVDPVSEYVFWADQGTRRVERSLLDGSDRKVLVEKEIAFPNQLAFSFSTRKLYWVDTKRQAIMSCDIDGNDVTKERDLVETSMGNPVFGLVVIGNTAIVSTWFHTKIASTFVATREAIWTNEVVIPSSTELYSVASTAAFIQPPSFHPCGQPDKGGCKTLCLPVRGSNYKCACSTYGGLALSFNAKSCESPTELLFFTLKQSGEVGFIFLRGAHTTYLTLVGRSSQPTAVTYDPIKQTVYWSDVEDKVIYFSSLDGKGEKDIFLSGNEGIGSVDGLALDWMNRELYFTNVGQSSPGVDGAVYSWHRLEKISLDKKSRRTLVSDVESPRGVTLDLDNGFLFYGDWGKKAVVIQAQLDGSERRVILDHDLAYPSGLSFYEGRLYVTDSNQNNRTSSPPLMVYDVATTEWTHLKLSNNFSIPMGLAVQGDTLYYSDWVSQDSPVGAIKSFNLRFGVDNNIILSGLRPSGLFYSPMTRKKTDSMVDVCAQSSCSHSCIKTPLNKERPYKCLCPDEATHMLSSNNVSCARPSNFLLVADLNTLQLVSLDDFSETGARTLLYSNINSNFVALMYDEDTDTMYWSDLTNQTIYASPFLKFEPRLVYKANYYIDGITVDADRQRLFWTGYSRNGSGLIARLNLQRGENSYHEIMQGLNNPRAIHILTEKKIIFWTQYGGKNGPACVKKAKINGQKDKLLKDHGLFWPNGLATYQQRLYVADGAGKIFSMDFDGSHQEELSFLTGPTMHLFGIVVMDTVLFYSDWLTNSVYMVDRITGKQETLLTHLSRPTGITVYHPTNLTVFNQCKNEGKICTGGCVSVPRTFHCTCPVGSKLASDGFSCITMASPWEVTEETKCKSQCHPNAYCAQLVPLLKFDCVCKAGYEGSGLQCSECGKDFYKPLLGNDSCSPCPLNATTKESRTATQCYCNDPQLTPVNNICTDFQITTSAMTMKTTTKYDEIKTDENIEQISTEPSITFLEPGGTISQPYFDQCPHGESIRKSIPETSNQIWLPINWRARDGYGKEIFMRSNFNITDNRISIPWMANGNGKQHTVVFEAKDSWNQIATCQFQVLVEDLVPPKFTSCPDNIWKKTSMNSEPISWVPPVAIDNAHDPMVNSTHEPKSEFLVGTTKVLYTATDWAGNSAHCTFNVTLIYEQPCQLPEIKNGVINCGAKDADTCYIACGESYILNPLGTFPHFFSCLMERDLQELIRSVRKQEPCLKHRRPTSAFQEFSLTFTGHCRPNSTTLKEILKEKVISKLEDKRICRGAKCTHSPMKITCNGAASKIRRFADQKFNMTWNVTIEYVQQPHENYDGFSPGQVKGILTDMKLELRKLAAHLTFFFEEKTYSSVPSSIYTKEFQWLCKLGEMKMNDGCVACPPGSYLNETDEQCVLCDEGFYQNMSASTQCLFCPVGVTLELGAISDAECITFPAMNEMSKFLIITSSSSAFLFLCLAIFLYFWYNRQHKKTVDAKTVDNGSRYTTPNLYGHPPIPTEKCPDYIRTSNQHFILGSHDYEDIDGQHRSTFETFSRRPPGCGDSLSSFKAHTDMTFLPTGSPNSLRASDDSYMPNSPRESAKSLNLFADGDIQYSHGTMESFKVSPPPSPYRSLHLVANGPIPRGTSASPTPNSHTLSSLLGDDSPYTSRLIRERLIDPDSPYRIISQERRNGCESPYKINRRLEPDTSNHMLSIDVGQDSPYRLVNRESPYRSPALQRELTHSLNRKNPDLGLRNYSHNSEISLKSMPETSSSQHHMIFDDVSAFTPVGDFLYKRPPSPLSPPISSKRSNDSLQRSPSTPRASPGMSRKRFDNPYKTSPMNQRLKNKPDFEVYEYE